MTPQQIELSDAIFCMGNRLTCIGVAPEKVEKLMRECCRIVDIEYPPERKDDE